MSTVYRYREQLNQVTHWLDSSQIYGSDLEEQRRLRSGRGGRLRQEGGGLLPGDRSEPDEACTGECFLAGDSR